MVSVIPPQNELGKFSGAYGNQLHCPSRREEARTAHRQGGKGCLLLGTMPHMLKKVQEEGSNYQGWLVGWSSPFQRGAGCPFCYLKYENFFYSNPGDKKP